MAKSKYPNVYSGLDLYNDYCIANPKYKDKYEDFTKIVNDTNKEIINYCLNTGKDFTIPFVDINLKVCRFLITPIMNKKLGMLMPRVSGADSRKKKKELEEQGLVVKSKENPDGVDATMYFTKSFYINWVVQFNKRNSGKNKNLKTKALYYKLKISKYARLLKIDVGKNESEDNLIKKYDVKNVFFKEPNS